MGSVKAKPCSRRVASWRDGRGSLSPCSLSLGIVLILKGNGNNNDGSFVQKRKHPISDAETNEGEDIRSTARFPPSPWCGLCGHPLPSWKGLGVFKRLRTGFPPDYNSRMICLSTSTSSWTSRLLRIISSTAVTECMAVVWSRLNFLAMLLNGRSRSCRQR